MSKATALLLAAVLWQVGPVAAQNTPEIRKISFAGAQSFDQELLRAAIVTNQTHCTLSLLCLFGAGIDRRYLDEIGLRGDLVRIRLFYFQHGFRAVSVRLDTIRNGNALDIRFTIAENEPVRVGSIDVTGMDELPPDPVLRRGLQQPLPLAVGAPFSLIAYETARDSLRARLVNFGFARAEVLANYMIPRDSKHVARVEFQIVAGAHIRFGPISVQGNQQVAPAVVRRMLTFGSGDPYSNDDLLRSQRNLFGLETFRHVEIRADVNATTDTLIPVVVQVNEGNLHRVRFGAGMSTAEFFNVEGLWTSRNFLGGARRLELRGRVYNVLADPLHYISPPFVDTRRPYNELSGSVSLNFSQPWFFDPQNAFNAGIYAERRSLPDVFVRTGRGAYLTFARGLGAGESFSFGYRPELTELTAGGDLVFCVNFVACGANEIQVLRDPHWLSPLTISYARDRANSLLAATAGYIVHVDAEYAARAIGSDFAYTRFTAEGTRYWEVARGTVLAGRLRPGFARPHGEPGAGLGLHPQKRFFGGGANSVRGFAQFRMGPKLLTINAAQTLADSATVGCTAQQINAGSCDVTELADRRGDLFDVRPVGGEAIMEGNVELRVPFFWDKLRAAGFVDFGQVWRQSRDVRLRDVVFTPGFGFRYFSAIGPVRVDVGYNPQNGERLQVLTTKVFCADTQTCSSALIEADKLYTSAQLGNTDDLVALGTVPWGADRKFINRFQLHFSIGQAF